MNIIKETIFYNVKIIKYKMSFFEKTNNQNKYYIYIILPKYDNVEYKSENTCNIDVKIIISKIVIPYNYSYIYENYKTIIKKYKDDIHDTYSLIYSFNFSLPVYPYDLFIFNRISLHSYIKVCENIKNINCKEEKVKTYFPSSSKSGNILQINFLCNLSYLKRTKEWGPIWKKNKFIIDKTNENIHTNMYNRILASLQEGNTKKTIADLGKTSTEKNIFEKELKEDNENLFSIYKLSKYYFDIVSENNYYKCELLDTEENFINNINKRPNYDYIDKCLEYFENENYKIII